MCKYCDDGEMIIDNRGVDMSMYPYSAVVWIERTDMGARLDVEVINPDGTSAGADCTDIVCCPMCGRELGGDA